LISKIAEYTGDLLHKHEYKRLSTLIVDTNPIQKFSDFKIGDCVVAFSRKAVFQIKEAINHALNVSNAK
jgi:ATP-dependent RNA helicase SUPV3L1/SUV3